MPTQSRGDPEGGPGTGAVGMEFSGSGHDNSCHICYRDLENHKPREGEVVAENGRTKFVTYTKGIGFCSEHGVSYDAISMLPPERGNCSCGKDDCPVCGQEDD